MYGICKQPLNYGIAGYMVILYVNLFFHSIDLFYVHRIKSVKILGVDNV